MSQLIVDAQEKTICGETFRVRMLDPLIAIELEVDILRLLGPAIGTVVASLLQAEDSSAALGQLMDGIKSTDGSLAAIGDSMDEDAKKAMGDLLGGGLERAIIGLVDRLDKAQLRQVIMLMQSVTEVKKGEKWPELSSVATVLFRGKLKMLHQWLAFAIRTQYRDFF